MKLLSFILHAAITGTIALSLSSCQRDVGPVTTQTTDEPARNLHRPPPYPPSSFGACFGLNGNPARIVEYGPNHGYGWKAIFLYPGRWPSDSVDFAVAEAEGYYPIVAVLDRDSVAQARWAFVSYQVTWGKQHQADWFCVDDALCGNWWDWPGMPDPTINDISREEISYVAQLVHQNNSLLATPECVQQYLEQNPTWHDDVDIMMPYNYTMTNPQDLDSFFAYVRTHYPAKQFVPWLGYHADVGNPPVFYFQRGVRGGWPGHIEVALNYITSNLIVYYCYAQDISYIEDLTCYLQSQYYMGPGHCTILW